jgi:hypothetical protein
MRRSRSTDFPMMCAYFRPLGVRKIGKAPAGGGDARAFQTERRWGVIRRPVDAKLTLVVAGFSVTGVTLGIIFWLLIVGRTHTGQTGTNAVSAGQAARAAEPGAEEEVALDAHYH